MKLEREIGVTYKDTWRAGRPLFDMGTSAKSFLFFKVICSHVKRLIKNMA